MRLFVFLLGLSTLCSCATDLQVREKIRGVSYVALRDSIGPDQVQPLIDIHASHASVMPYGFIRDENSTEIIFNTPRQWFGERDSGVRQYVEQLHKRGVAVMVKPHLWIGRGKFTGDMVMNNEADWRALEASYRAYILFFANLSEEVRAEMFCVGTELHSFAILRQEFFRNLIREVRTVYSGKLTYAENWDQFDKIEFWDDLDFIGVDAYFPLSESKTPGVPELRSQWEAHKADLEDCALKFGKPILFAEYGYRSTDFNARTPWDSSRSEGTVNLQAQVNAMRALAEEIWFEDWFAGGFLWKWFPFHDRAGGEQDNQFTIQNKPAEQVVRELYKKRGEP